MQTLFQLVSPAGTVLMELGAPIGYAAAAVILAAGVTIAAASALVRR